MVDNNKIVSGELSPDITSDLIERCVKVLLARDIGTVFVGEDISPQSDEPAEADTEWRRISKQRASFEVRHKRMKQGTPTGRRRRGPVSDSCAVAWRQLSSQDGTALRHALNDGFRAAGFEVYQTVPTENDGAQPENIVFETHKDGLPVRGATYRFPDKVGDLVLAEVNTGTQTLLSREGQ